MAVKDALSSEDRSALETRVSEGLASAFTDDGTDEIVNLPEQEERKPATEKADEVVAEVEAEPTDEVVAEAEAESTETDPEAKANPEKEAAAVESTGPTLPAAYRRTLKAYEWTDEEIENALKTGGEQFVASASKMHATRSREISQFAALGRASRQQPAAAPAIESPKPVDVDALTKLYGDETFIKNIAGPLNQTVAQINAALPRIQAMEQVAQQAQLEQLGRQVDTFFKTNEGVAEYGDTAATATEAQLSARMKVLELADALRSGSRQQGRNLTFDEALQIAYDTSSTVTKATTARKEVVKQLQTRAKAVTLRPQTKATVVKTGPDRTAIEAKVRKGLAAVFA